MLGSRVDIRQLRKSYAHGGRVLDVLRGIDLSIGAGEMVAVVGSSGAGKSTLLHVIGTLDQPTSGNIMFDGIVGVQKEVVLAAKRSIVTVEEIVDDFGPRSANAVILPAWTVSTIVQVPGGAYPSYAQGYYRRDNAFYIGWEAIARERETFRAWMKANVLEKGPEVFAEHVRPHRARAA